MPNTTLTDVSSRPDPRPAVLLLHGLCANPLEMMPLARSLRDAGYVVEAPALDGYGVVPRSPARRPPTGRRAARSRHSSSGSRWPPRTSTPWPPGTPAWPSAVCPWARCWRWRLR
ncbi:hypothetical protein [Roseateles chitinivorans]|uniref:hypothetical protein n=1 Tax=Roseateles chitinivorans TaxID=2917965 RepID=UPI003D66C3DF